MTRPDRDRRHRGRAGTLSELVSPPAIAISWLLVGATPEPLAIVGGALCVVGVAVARLRGRLRPAYRNLAGRSSRAAG